MSINEVPPKFHDDPRVVNKINELVRELNDLNKYVGTVRLDLIRLKKDFSDYKTAKRQEN